MLVLETLKKHQLLANLKKCEFLAVFGVFGVCDRWRGAHDRFDKDGSHHEMTSSYKCHYRSLVGVTQYLQKFIASL
jgi:hypothetical protein